MGREAEEKIMFEIRQEEKLAHARRTNPRAQGLIEGQKYRHAVNGDVYHLQALTNLNTTKPGWDVQVVYHPVGDSRNIYSRPITEFLEKFTEA
jgi:hypothetical protein